jgi:hypothetical protein
MPRASKVALFALIAGHADIEGGSVANLSVPDGLVVRNDSRARRRANQIAKLIPSPPISLES